MICPIGVRWRREMRQAHKQASEENLRSKGSNYRVILSAKAPHQHKSPICSFICFLLLICCGRLISIFAWLWAAFGEWTGTTEFHTDSVLLSWSCSFPSPFSGASIISKQLSRQPVPRPNHNRPITGQLCVWIWTACSTAAFANIPLPFHVFLSLSVILFLCFSPLANEILPTSVSNKL